jgi:hypothetical protein
VQLRITGGFGLFSSSGIRGNRNTTFRKQDLFPSSVEAGKKIPTHLGRLEGANLNLSELIKQASFVNLIKSFMIEFRKQFNN